MKTLELETRIPFDFRHTVHLVDNRCLVIAPDLATFFVTDRPGLALFEAMKAGASPIQAVLDNSARQGFAFVFKAMMELLSQLSRALLLTPEQILDERNYPNPSLHIYVTNRCNLACVHCYRYAAAAVVGCQGKPSKVLSEAEISQLLEDYTTINPEGNIVFSGGEPLLRPDIYRILAKAKNLGHHTALFTNGTLIDERVAGILAGLVDVVQISLDGATEEPNDMIRGAGTYQKIMRAITLLSLRRMAMDVAVTLNPGNKDDLLRNHEVLEQLVLSRHCKTIRVAVVRHQGRARSTWQSLDQSGLESSAQALVDLFIKAGISHEAPPRPKIRYNCGFGPGFHVDWQGDVYPCREEEQFRLSNIRLEPLSQIYDKIYKQYLDTSVERIEACSSCDLKHICTGGCRVTNFCSTGKYTFRDCSEEVRQELYRKLAHSTARSIKYIERRHAYVSAETGT